MFRWLRQRDDSRKAGDKLATTVQAYLTGQAGPADLCLALRDYQHQEQYLGPAASWTRDLIDFETDTQA